MLFYRGDDRDMAVISSKGFTTRYSYEGTPEALLISLARENKDLGTISTQVTSRSYEYCIATSTSVERAFSGTRKYTYQICIPDTCAVMTQFSGKESISSAKVIHDIISKGRPIAISSGIEALPNAIFMLQGTTPENPLLILLDNRIRAGEGKGEASFFTTIPTAWISLHK